MEHVPLEKIYDEELAKLEKSANHPIDPQEMGISCRTVNGGYIVIGNYRKTMSLKQILKRRQHVETLLKKYAL